jgi:hypothetical protein
MELQRLGDDRPVKRTQRDVNRADRLISALAAKSEEQDLLYVSQALILCGLPYAPTSERRIIREAQTARGRVRVTFQAVLEDVPMPYGKDAVLLSYLTTLALLSDSPTVTFENAKDYMEQFGEDTGGRSYRLFAERWRRLAGLVIAVERHGDASHNTELQVVIRHAKLPSKSKLMAVRSGTDTLTFPGSGPYYSVTLGTDFWNDLRGSAVPLLLPVMRAFANRPLAWHFVQFLCWRSFVSQTAADHGRNGVARIDWAELRLMLGSSTSYEKRLRRELRTIIADLKVIWPQCNAAFDGTTLCIAPPASRIALVDSKQVRAQRRIRVKWRRIIAAESAENIVKPSQD